MARTLLLVDDHPDTLLATRMVLERAGYEVRTSTSAAQALSAYRSRPADVVITDLLMPDMDGLELVAVLRREFPGTRVMLLSGMARPGAGTEELFSAQDARASAMLAKPYAIEELLHKIEELLSAG